MAQPERFAEIFERHHAAIHRYLRGRLGDDLADDLAAETFAVAFRGRSRYDLERPDARPWLFGIATNLTRNHRRTERRRWRAYAALRPDAEDAFDADASDMRLDARDVLAGALAKLPKRQRDVLLLHAWGDLSDAEIGLALGVPVGTVQSRLSRARSAMREVTGGDRTIRGCG